MVVCFTVCVCVCVRVCVCVQKELLQTRAELERMRAELEKRFSDTAQYANLRKMLASKNDQIRELRAQLKK